MTHQMPFLHNRTQRKRKDVASDAHQMPIWCDIRCKTFLDNYGCGCIWAVPAMNVQETKSVMQNILQEFFSLDQSLCVCWACCRGAATLTGRGRQTTTRLLTRKILFTGQTNSWKTNSGQESAYLVKNKFPRTINAAGKSLSFLAMECQLFWLKCAAQPRTLWGCWLAEVDALSSARQLRPTATCKAQMKSLLSIGRGRACPKNLLRLFFLPQNLFLFSEVIFKDPPKICFKTSIKRTSRGYFYFSRLFFALRGYFLKIASKDS